MKRSLLALAALTAFAGAASAQSSVTLFGIVDLNLRSVDNGSVGTIKSMSTDGTNSSRIGFRGTEDMGGGLKAGFWLEGGLAADVGNQGGGNGGVTLAPASAPWNRRATVSLEGPFGEIRLGRDYVPTFWNHTVFDVFGTNGVASETNIISPAPTVAPFGNAQTLVRANNTVGYFLPAMGGIYGQIMVAAGENQVPANKYVGGRLGYAAGPVNMAIAYGKTSAGGAMAGDMKAWNVGGSFDLGAAKVYGQYFKYEEGPVKELTSWSLGVGVPLGAATLKASYGKTDRTLAVNNEPSATQLGLGVVYDLSKRSALYAHYGRVKNDKGLVYTASTGGPAASALAGFTSTGYEFGLRHSF